MKATTTNVLLITGATGLAIWGIVEFIDYQKKRNLVSAILQKWTSLDVDVNFLMKQTFARLNQIYTTGI